MTPFVTCLVVLMKNIIVEEMVKTPVEMNEIELVERKGIGHPDSIADGIAESISRALCKEYLKRVGMILHHNTDETQIVAGKSNPYFGGGEVISPIYVLLVGRATKQFDGEYVPTDTIAIKAAKEYIRNNFRNLDVDADMIIDCKLGEGSTDLKDIFLHRKDVPRANDTSFGVGFAPLSETERIVYNIEREIYNTFRRDHPEIGEDVKVMGLRIKDKINLTIACAFVSKYVPNLDHYRAVKDELVSFVQDIAGMYTEREVTVNVNTGDNYEKGIVYLTVTGTSAENGDDGSVGRGNRCNGLITPNRPMSMEATSGKNPINHIGKIYNILANQIAHDAVDAVEGIEEIYVRILSEIGSPINDPKVVSIQVLPKKGYSIKALEPKIKTVAEEWLEDIYKVTEMIIQGEVNTF